MGRQQILVNAFFVLLGFVVSGGLKHLFNKSNGGQGKISSSGIVFDKQTTNKQDIERSDDDGEGSSIPEEEEIDSEETSSSTTKNNAAIVPPRRPDQQVQFLYFMGLEGAGHEYLHNISMESPMIKQYLQEFDSVYPHDIQVIQNSLLDKDYGLWSAYFSPKPGEMLNLTDTRARLVETLSSINKKITSKKGNSNNNEQRYYIPINILNLPFGDYGRVRYLELKEKNIRMIQYPSIDLFYDACDEANVDCRHVYIYRNPYEILHKSTAPHVLEAMHTSISMLLVIASQMRIHSDRTLACWNLFAAAAAAGGSDNNNNNNMDEINGLATIFGWKEDDTTESLSNVMKDNYIPLQIDDGTKVSDIVPAMNQNYFDSMMKSHKMVLEVCHQNQEFG